MMTQGTPILGNPQMAPTSCRLLQLALTQHVQPLLINEASKARQERRGGAVQLLVQLEVT